MDGSFLTIALIGTAVLSLLLARRVAKSRRTCGRERSRHSAVGGRGWFGSGDGGGWFGGGVGGGWGGDGGGCGGGDGGGG
jgi:hypothetical protein